MFDSPKNKKLTGPILYGTTHKRVNKIEGGFFAIPFAHLLQNYYIDMYRMHNSFQTRGKGAPRGIC